MLREQSLRKLETKMMRKKKLVVFPFAQAQMDPPVSIVNWFKKLSPKESLLLDKLEDK